MLTGSKALASTTEVAASVTATVGSRTAGIAAPACFGLVCILVENKGSLLLLLSLLLDASPLLSLFWRFVAVAGTAVETVPAGNCGAEGVFARSVFPFFLLFFFLERRSKPSLLDDDDDDEEEELEEEEEDREESSSSLLLASFLSDFFCGRCRDSASCRRIRFSAADSSSELLMLLVMMVMTMDHW
jgi:hypothetical protein